MADVFDDDIPQSLIEKTFECGECGLFTKRDHTYTYDRDKHEPGVAAGITLGTTTIKPRD